VTVYWNDPVKGYALRKQRKVKGTLAEAAKSDFPVTVRNRETGLL
jgi:hypothetical protein